MKRSEVFPATEFRGDDVGAAQPITLTLIVDNRLLRDGLAAVIQLRSDFQVLSASANADAALLLAGEMIADVVLLDFGLTAQSSVDVAIVIRLATPTSKIVVMGVMPGQDEIAEFVRAGVSGFILKDASFDELVETVTHVAAGGQVLPRALTTSLFAQIVHQERSKGRPPLRHSVRVTAREREVIDALGQGMSNKEIAALLHIAVHTVKSHVHNVLEKLSLNSRLEVAAFLHASMIDHKET